MTAKDYLQRAYSANCDIELTKKKLEVLKNAQDGATDSESKEKLDDVQAKLNREINTLLDTWAEVEGVICRVENATYRDVLTRRYLLFQRWSDISAATYYDRRWLFRVHNKALACVKFEEGDTE